MSIATLLLAVWTTICWFSQPYGTPFLNLPVFAVDVSIPAFLMLLAATGGLFRWTRGGGIDRTRARLRALAAHRLELLLLGATIAFYLVLVAIPVTHVAGETDSDSARTGIAGYHIARGESRPMYNYGLHYIGMLIPHLTAPLHLVFGPDPGYQRIICALFYCGFLIFTFLLGRMAAGAAGGFAAALIAALPPAMVARQLRYTEFAEIAFWGSLAFYLLVRLLAREKPGARAVFWLGVVLGIVLYMHPQALYLIAATGVTILIRDWRFFLKPAWWMLPLGLVLGSAVFWVNTWYSGGTTFRYFIGVESGVPAGIVERVTHNGAAWLRHLGEFFGSSITHPPIPGVGIILTGLMTLLVCGSLVSFLFLGLRRTTAPGVSEEGRQVLLLAPITFFLVSAIFLISGKAWMNPAFRYVFPLWLVLPILSIAPWTILRGGARQIAGIATLALFVLVLAWSHGHYLESVRAQESDMRSWEAFLRERGITRFYGSFWLVYHAGFVTREEIFGSSSYPTCYVPYQPYHWRTEDDPGHPAFVYLTTMDRDAEGQAQWLGAALDALGVSYVREQHGPRIVFHHLSERITPKQILGIPVQSAAVITVDGVRRVVSNEADTGMRMVTLSVGNSGKGFWTTEGGKGFIELVVRDHTGNEIRRQPLMRDVSPGEAVSWRVLLAGDELNGSSRALVQLNGIDITRDKMPVKIDPATVTGPDLDLVSIRYPGPGGEAPPDYALLSGWGRAEGGRRWSGAARAELGLVLVQSDPRRRFVHVKADVVDSIGGTEGLRLALELGGARMETTLIRSGIIRIPLKETDRAPGLHRLRLEFSATEATWEDRKGYPVFRARPAALGLARVTMPTRTDRR